jgi:hypothetical protein
VIQTLDPYVSSEDIDKGAKWSTDIAKELSESHYGILCVTRENIDAPWLNFEAGALSKSIDKSLVSPFLFGLKRSEVRTGPLLQFQSTIYENEDIGKLLHSLNNAAAPASLDDARLDGIFQVWWPKLQELLGNLASSTPEPGEGSGVSVTRTIPAAQSQILEEVLELVRSQNKLLNSPEALFPPDYLAHVVQQADRSSLRDLGPYRDAFERYVELREFLAGLKDDEAIPVGELREKVDRVGAPLEWAARHMRLRLPPLGPPGGRRVEP